MVFNSLDVQRCYACGGVRSGFTCCPIGGSGSRCSCAVAACRWRVDAPLKSLWGGRTMVMAVLDG
jgi:hypothetical protein